jgi:hypothetical protein
MCDVSRNADEGVDPTLHLPTGYCHTARTHCRSDHDKTSTSSSTNLTNQRFRFFVIPIFTSLSKSRLVLPCSPGPKLIDPLPKIREGCKKRCPSFVAAAKYEACAARIGGSRVRVIARVGDS